MCVLCKSQPWGTPRLLESELNMRITLRFVILLAIVASARKVYGEDESE
jgi:hypothetical protein